ncbi:MAG: NTP transferase domain-containing protein [Phycisphaera sp.]|nr:NTP transferase domain-containing protein [Phycisphaera sp.]
MDDNLRIAVILPAAGQSKRFGDKPKLEQPLAGRAVLVRSVELFSGRPEVKQIIVAVDPDNVDTFKFRWGDQLGFFNVKIVAGGRIERWETVKNALDVVDDDITHVAVHDAARPVADAAMIDRVFTAAATHPAVVPAVRVSATVKRVDAKPAASTTAEVDPLDAILGAAGKQTVEAYPVLETVPRGNLWLAQTPQLVAVDLLKRAYAAVAAGKIDTASITDDVGLVEALGEPVVAVEGDPLNVKITVPDDLKFAEAVLNLRSGKTSKDLLGPKRKHPTWAQSSDDE